MVVSAFSLKAITVAALPLLGGGGSVVGISGPGVRPHHSVAAVSDCRMMRP
jgi:hypothetical protein